MTVRENVHQIIDTVPEERLDEVLDYLAGFGRPDDPLGGADTLAGIAEGLEDVRSGRTITLDEYRRSRGL